MPSCTTILRPGRRLSGLLLCLALAAAAAGPAAGQCIRVGATLPVVGRPVTLTVRVADGGDLPDGVRVVFRVVPESADGDAAWTGEASAKAGSAAVPWAATAPGPYRVEAEVDGHALAPVRVFAVTSPLFFSFWACPLTQRYATAVMENGNSQADADRWLDRGILPLEWKPGAIAGHEKPEEWAADYVSVRPGRAGITIDEFWGAPPPPHRDEPACLGLLAARARAPHLFQAPYCLTVEREVVRRAFAQADLCQVELYRRDFRSYPDLVGALRVFADAGLGDHTIPVLAAGPGNALWITTEAEMRRQIEAIRWALPDIPGVGFFPEFYPGLAEAADRAILDYYLGPVILVRGGDLRNIGQMPARSVHLRLADGSEQSIERLEPGARRDVPPGAEAIPGEGYVVISPQPQPAPRPTPGQAAELAALVGACREVDLGSPAVERAESPDPDVNGQISGATIPLGAPLEGGPATLGFDLAVKRCNFYGTIGVSLVGAGSSSLGMSLSHNDHDRDLPADHPRAEFVARSEAKIPVSETCPLGLRPGASYRLVLSFDGARRIRLGVFEIVDGEPRLEWAADLPFTGPLKLDRVRFSVRPYQGSTVEPTPDGILLRGVSGGEKPSPYVLEAVVSHVRVGGAERR